MGQRFAPSYANIYMSEWERESLAECTHKPLTYLRTRAPETEYHLAGAQLLNYTYNSTPARRRKAQEQVKQPTAGPLGDLYRCCQGVAGARTGTMGQEGAPTALAGGSSNMMSGVIKANIAHKTVSETSSQQLRPGTPPPGCATPDSGTPSPPDDSSPGPCATSSPFSPLQSDSNAAGKFKTTYHISRPHRKIQDWFIKGRKPVLVLGDSNINRIPPHNHPTIQLDSYPGANMYHFLKLCEKAIPTSEVKIVILSIVISGLETSDRWTIGQRKRAEKIWIHKMNTIVPTGLNDNVIQMRQARGVS
ncbi:unnamed protein product [Pleuronectes platessa]|uniref:Uncharacterized protein n=1 Tax=Pleuronectes platessa TaxID=8262 RepID=A0A9N7URG9_PLEPL|nr:unnamed protein product [Pleuronectes platessa]